MIATVGSSTLFGVEGRPVSIEVHVSRLRAKLGDAGVIRSLRGLGYRLEEAKSP